MFYRRLTEKRRFLYMKEVVARWVSISSPKQQMIRQEDMASSCTRGGLNWEKFLHQKGYPLKKPKLMHAKKIL